MKLQITRRSEVHCSGRVLQMSGIFDLPKAKVSEVAWQVNLPIEDKPWNIGLIVGPSGVGKSTIARECFGAAVVGGYDWPADRSLLDAFPAAMGIKEITGLLSSVGFSSPPSWLRPFGVLSTGEQFRVFVARDLQNDDVGLDLLSAAEAVYRGTSGSGLSFVGVSGTDINGGTGDPENGNWFMQESRMAFQYQFAA